MSWSRCPEALIGQPVLAAVFLALDSHADRDGRCWPSIARLAGMVGRNRRTVERALTQLEALGYVSREQRSGKSTVYKCRCDTDVAPGCDTHVAQNQNQLKKERGNGKAMNEGVTDEQLQRWVGVAGWHYTDSKRAFFAEARQSFGMTDDECAQLYERALAMAPTLQARAEAPAPAKQLDTNGLEQAQLLRDRYRSAQQRGDR